MVAALVTGVGDASQCRARNCYKTRAEDVRMLKNSDVEKFSGKNKEEDAIKVLKSLRECFEEYRWAN